MDLRWKPVNRDSQRSIKVILHPTAAIYEVRRGLDVGSDDSIDLSEFVSQGTHTAFEASVTLSFNRELFGDFQPKPNQILEIQLWEAGAWKPCWLGVVDNISQFTLQRGTRSMQLIAKSRDQEDIWRNTKRLTPLFPQLTNLTYMAERIARSAGLKGDEILLPVSAFTTAHSNTQLADMNAWDMLTAIFQAMGWTPFIDCVGRLRAADRGLVGRRPDVMLEDDRLVRVGGSRQRPPKSRVRVLWLNPVLKKHKRQGQMVGQETITLGWFIPYWKRKVWFSADHTLRAEGTYINWEKSTSVNQFAKEWLGFDFVEEKWLQQTETSGKLSFRNWQSVAALIAFGTMIGAMAGKRDKVVGTVTVPLTGPGIINPDAHTEPVGSIYESIAMAAWATMAMTLGTGTYEIWGVPYDWVHARNISEAFDSSVPTWVDNSVDIESDFVVNEEHAKAMCIRELIYQAREANKWSVTIVDDPRIEYGDILQFHDGTQLYVEDFSRKLERGSPAELDVSGFMIPKGVVVGQGSLMGGGAPGFPGGFPPGVNPPTGPGGKYFIWAWSDRGGPTPDAPGSQAGAPTTMDQWEAYFFGLINRTKGSPANDYETVLNGLKDQGMKVNPTPGEVPQVSWPFYGMSVMIDAGGHPRGRIWLPTPTPDANNYYTHEIQVIGDDPNPPDGGGSGGGGGDEFGPDTMPDYRNIAQSVADQWNLTVPSDQEEQGKAQLCRLIAWEIYQQDPNIGLFKKTGGNQVMNLSTDLCIQKPDGSFADCTTAKNNGNGTHTIKVSWGTHAPDKNTHDPVESDRWIQPTQALADAPGPLTRK